VHRDRPTERAAAVAAATTQATFGIAAVAAGRSRTAGTAKAEVARASEAADPRRGQIGSEGHRDSDERDGAGISQRTAAGGTAEASDASAAS
jgi:hypothetical protein